MKTNLRFHPRLDALEDRTCPTGLSIYKYYSLLVVTGVPIGNVSIQETGSNSFSVQDDATTPRSFGGVSAISISLGRSNSTVDIDLNGFTFAGNISAAFAGGNNNLSIEDGTAGYLSIRGGIGSNDINLGVSSPLKVSRDVVVSLAGNTADTLTVLNTKITGSLTVSNTNFVYLDSASTVGRNAVFYAALAGTVVNDNATVTSDVMFFGSGGTSTGRNQLLVNGTVGLDLIFSSTWYNTVGNEVDVNANVARSVSIATGGVNDNVTIAPGVTIGGNLTVNLVRGNDNLTVSDYVTIRGSAVFYLGYGTRTVNFGATVGNNTNVPVFAIFGGVGIENVTFTTGATFRGQGLVALSRYSMNTVTFASPETFNTFAFVIDGGLGGFNTLNLWGTGGSRLYYRDFWNVYR